MFEADLVPLPASPPWSHSGLTADGDGSRLIAAASRRPVFGVTLSELSVGLPLPKAGIIAELEGPASPGRSPPRSKPGTAAAVRGHGQCFIEMGPSTATLIEGEFFAEPEPVVMLRAASPETAEHKRRFEAARLARWFGR